MEFIGENSLQITEITAHLPEGHPSRFLCHGTNVSPEGILTLKRLKSDILKPGTLACSNTVDLISYALILQTIGEELEVDNLTQGVEIKYNQQLSLYDTDSARMYTGHKADWTVVKKLPIGINYTGIAYVSELPALFIIWESPYGKYTGIERLLNGRPVNHNVINQYKIGLPDGFNLPIPALEKLLELCNYHLPENTVNIIGFLDLLEKSGLNIPAENLAFTCSQRTIDLINNQKKS